jgi:hypothetical protein
VSGHRASRRQSYGRRRRDVRDRRASDLTIDLEGPADWMRVRGWGEPTPRPGASSHLGAASGVGAPPAMDLVGRPGSRRDPSLDSAGA